MDAISIYHRLPYPLKVAAASLHGSRLKRVRYPRESSALSSEAVAREFWPPSQWEGHERAALRRVLAAASTAPWYGARGCDPDLPLEQWPVVTKADVRADPASFRSTGYEGPVVEDHTSGTSGTPLTLFFDRETVRARYALHVARVLQWNGVDASDRWAIIGGRLVAPVGRSRPPYWVWNASGRQLYLSAFHIGPRTVASYADALRRHRVRWLLGYPSAITALATFAREERIPLPQLAFVATNAEPLTDDQRSIISTAFMCAVREEYGSSETVVAASECAAQRLHRWPEVGHVEVLADASDDPVPVGDSGRLVCTGLLNVAMPLVRYEVGDRGALSSRTECECGRTLPIVERLEGRTDDVLVTADGRSIGRLDGVFKSDLPIHEAQIAQLAPNRFEVRVVPAAGYSALASTLIEHNVRERVGPASIEVLSVDRIPRTSIGKFRAVVNEMPNRPESLSGTEA